MPIHVFQHVPFEDPAGIRVWAKNAGQVLRTTRFFRNDPLPDPGEITHLIVLGGPMGVHDHAACPWLKAEKRFIREAIAAGRSVLGICLGAQLMASAMGAAVYRNAVPEIGWFPIEKAPEARKDAAAAFLPDALHVFHWHADTFDLPAGARCLAHSQACRHQGFFLDGRVIGLQFHLETTPASLEALIHHCSEELVAGPFIQSAAAMRGEIHRYAPNQQIMAALLTQWMAA